MFAVLHLLLTVLFAVWWLPADVCSVCLIACCCFWTFTWEFVFAGFCVMLVMLSVNCVDLRFVLVV